MAVSLDLRKAWKHQRHGDLIVVLTWVNDQRTLVLMPALRRGDGWYMVQESAAYLWGVDHDEPRIAKAAMLHAVEQSTIACDVLGLEPSKMNRGRVISIIAGWIPDLCRMPSEPEAQLAKAAYGQMILSANGVPIAGEDLREEVAGVTYG